MNPAERVRQALKRWLDTSDLTERQFVQDLKKSQPWLDKVLSGVNNVTLKDLDQVAAAMRTTASELVRDDEERYRLELSPTEVRLIERIRHGGPNAISAMHWLLGQLPKPESQSIGLRHVGQTSLRPLGKRATKAPTVEGARDDVHMVHGRPIPADADPAAALAALRAFLTVTINDIADAAAGAIPDRQVSGSVPDTASDRGVVE